MDPVQEKELAYILLVELMAYVNPFLPAGYSPFDKSLTSTYQIPVCISGTMVSHLFPRRSSRDGTHHRSWNIDCSRDVS